MTKHVTLYDKTELFLKGIKRTVDAMAATPRTARVLQATGG